MIPVSSVAHHEDTMMVLMVVMEVVAGIHYLMVMIDHN
jgi:hypothetical protein